MYYLLKTEPSAYSFADLQRDQTTIWDGVTNPVAVKHLREMPTGAKLVLYHTGDERQAIGTATVESVDASDPRNPKVRIKAGKKMRSPLHWQRSRATSSSRNLLWYGKAGFRSCLSRQSNLSFFRAAASELMTVCLCWPAAARIRMTPRL